MDRNARSGLHQRGNSLGQWVLATQEVEFQSPDESGIA